MAKFADTKDYLFTKFCDTYKQFSIPNFQRPYSWKNKELQEFWSSMITNDKNYFIGNIVTIKPEDTDDSAITIVDGQQRLTTIFLFLAALRDIYRNIQERDADKDRVEIDDKIASINYRIYHRDPHDKKHVRLTLGNKSYQDVFDEIMHERVKDIDPKKLDKQQYRYLTNYLSITKYIKDYIKNSELSKLLELKDKLFSLQFVAIVLESDVEIYNIFEGFNSTGLGLTPADLIKNAVLKGTYGQLSEQEEAEYYWREMEELFEQTDPTRLTRFLRYYWMINNGYTSSGNLFKQVKENEINEKTPEEVKKYVMSLNENAKIYLGLLYKEIKPPINLPDPIFDELLKFRYIRNEQIYVVLLSIYKKICSEKLLKEKDWIKIIKNLWRFIVRVRYSDISPSSYERLFASMSQYIYETNDKQSLINKLDKDFEELFLLVDSDDSFVKHFVQDASYKTDKGLIKEAFISIHYNFNEEIILNHPEIEHILPQNPEKWGLNKIDVEDYVHSIGNLTLLTSKDNREECKDNTFEVKSKVYLNSAFELNNEIVTRWGNLFISDYKTAIDQRGEELARQINKLWKYDKLK